MSRAATLRLTVTLLVRPTAQRVRTTRPQPIARTALGTVTIPTPRPITPARSTLSTREDGTQVATASDDRRHEFLRARAHLGYRPRRWVRVWRNATPERR